MEYLLSIGITIVLVILAAIFSGLNISLMSLSVADLKRKARLGNKDAKRILPLRKNAYLSLASILFGNVAVVSASTLTLEGTYNGLIAGIATTILMVVFGELLPQAIFINSALKFCAFFAPLIKFMTIITYPLSKPLALMLDKLIGQQDRILHTRAELGMLISEHKIANESELDENSATIKSILSSFKETAAKDL